MRKIFTLTALALLSLIICAQTPNKLSYQAVIRNSSNQLVVSHAIGIRISILQGSANGSAIYTETQTTSTNANGLISIEIGGETGFSTINWANGPLFIMTETDPSGGTNYTITGVTQLLSVPYALHAKTAESITGTINYNETDPIFASSAAKNINSSNIVDWNSAFSWGNHSNAGYLTGINHKSIGELSDVDLSGIGNNKILKYSSSASKWIVADASGAAETDPVFSAHTASGITTSQINNWQAAHAWGDHALAGYIKTYTETDPFFSISVAKNINSSDINNWNTAYEWGNHASAGYIKNFTETDPLFANNFSFNSPFNNQLIKYNSTTNKWENWTPNYISAEIDGSVINELQTLTLSSNQLSISGTTGNSVTFTNWDIDSTNDVTTSGDQTIAGNKTFTGTTTVATPVNPTDAATKAYVDQLKSQIEELQVLAGVKVKDIDGNVYSIVTIGTQKWILENLRTRKLNDGTPIAQITDNESWSGATSSAYCWYNNDSTTYEKTYGKLYNWYTINTNKLCPTGWHTPTDTDWSNLETFLGGSSVAGEKIKEVGTTHWGAQNTTNATNESGFTALPGGIRFHAGYFADISMCGYFWSTYTVGSNGSGRTATDFKKQLDFNWLEKSWGASVRCIKD